MDRQPQIEIRSTDESCCIVTQHLKNIISWKNNVTSTAVLTLINVAFILFHTSEVSFVSLLCILGIIILLMGYLSSLVIHSETSVFEVITKQKAEKLSVFLYDLINGVATDIRNIILWRDNIASAKTCAILGVLAYISSLFPISIMFFIGINALICHQQIIHLYHKYASEHTEQVLNILKAQFHKMPKSSQAYYKKH